MQMRCFSYMKIPFVLFVVFLALSFSILSTLLLAGCGEGSKDEVSVKKAEFPAKKKVVLEIAPPTVSGYETTGEGRIVPDFKMNKDYNLANINDFMLALVEANKTRNEGFYDDNILLPGITPVWGHSLAPLKSYKIESINPANPIYLEDVPDELKNGAEFYQVNIGIEAEIGDSIENHGWSFMVAKKDGRFYLVKGI